MTSRQVSGGKGGKDGGKTGIARRRMDQANRRSLFVARRFVSLDSSCVRPIAPDLDGDCLRSVSATWEDIRRRIACPFVAAPGYISTRAVSYAGTIVCGDQFRV
jgi:hypothetical protein